MTTIREIVDLVDWSLKKMNHWNKRDPEESYFLNRKNTALGEARSSLCIFNVTIEIGCFHLFHTDQDKHDDLALNMTKSDALLHILANHSSYLEK